MKRVALHTLGCKLNFAETSTIGRQFLERGFEVVGADSPSDVFVLNTCSVTERADRECRQLIRRVLRRSPETFVIVTGCYAQLRPEEVTSIHGVDLVLGANEKFRIFVHEAEFEKFSAPQSFVSCLDDTSTFDPAFSAEVGGRTRAFLKIQDGCDFSCTFCTIPLARGSSRSQGIGDVLVQAESLAEQGYREIVLTGVNIGDYGRASGATLLDLLKNLENVEGIDRFRVSSIEPNLLTPELIDFIAGSEKFCRHFHIPLQSGSDSVLRAMRRRYTARGYRNVIEQIRRVAPVAGIGVDVIAGFPGESHAHFRETFDFLETLPISYLHVFTYSEREHTPAASAAGAVEPRVRYERSEALRRLGKSKRLAFHASFVGLRRNVLFENPEGGGMNSGCTSEYVRVEVDAGVNLQNRMAAVDVTGASPECCTGTLAAGETPSKGVSLSKSSAHDLTASPYLSHELISP